MKKTALIVGATGQDGAYLAHHLLDLGYKVTGTSRDSQVCDTSRLRRLGIHEDVQLVSLAPNDFRSTLKVVSTCEPCEIYNLAGQTSVSLSFDQPIECMESISSSTITMLEAIRYLGAKIKYFNAGSSDCFGDIGKEAATEETPFHPQSPYAVAKAASFWQTSTYRKAYGLFACTGILSNHESPLRPDRFVTQKIIQGVLAIKEGKQDVIQLGNLNIWRDWGWAPDYVRAMHLMLQASKPKDYLIASGKSTSLRSFVEEVFRKVGIDIAGRVVSIETLCRPSDITYSRMNPSLIRSDLGWTTSMTVSDIVEKMCTDTVL